MTLDVVVFPDVVELTIGYFNAELPGRGETATATSKVPKDRPARFVTVQHGGGARASLVVDGPTVLVECWAESDQAAHDLAQLCRALLLAMRGTVQNGVPVYRVDEFGGPVNLPDPVSKQARSVFTHSIQVRGSAA